MARSSVRELVARLRPLWSLVRSATQGQPVLHLAQPKRLAAHHRLAVTGTARDGLTARGDLSTAGSLSAPKTIAPPFDSASAKGSLRRVGAPRNVAVVTIENQTQELGRFRDVQRFLEELAGCPMGGDDDQKPVDPFSRDSTIRDGHQGRGIDDDVVVFLSSLAQKVAHPR